MLKGIDLSFWQRETYKNFIDNYAEDFVIVRATFGRYVDEYCDAIYQYAKSKGKKLGFYMFPLTSEGDPRESAEWHYNQVLGYIREAIPCVDWEATNGTDVSNVEWAYQFLKRFEELSGVKPMIYMNSSCEASYDWSKVVANDVGLWIANYGPNDGQDHGVPGLVHWPFWAIHQFTSQYAGNSLDANVFNGDREAWNKYAGKNSSTDPTPTPTPTPARKTVEELAQAVIRGEYGNGEERKQRLTAEGYDYDAVQNRVNEIMSPKEVWHTVQPGETLTSIASQYDTTWQEIARLNNLANPDLIFPNQKVRVK